MEGGRALAEVTVKQVTGGDTITARRLYAEHIEFKPQFTLLLATNHKPRIVGTDHAIWRRIALTPFTVTIPDCEQDPELSAKLRVELPGILNWALAGCLEWQRDRLSPPETVRSATTGYRDEMDTLGDFLAERCVIEDGASATSKELYAAYTSWASTSGEKPVSKTALGLRLAERGFLNGPRTSTGNVWLGLRIVPDGGFGL